DLRRGPGDLRHRSDHLLGHRHRVFSLQRSGTEPQRRPLRAAGRAVAEDVMASPTKLNLLPYLQHWNGARLQLRLLAVPRGNPLDPLLPPAGPSFATADFAFD